MRVCLVAPTCRDSAVPFGGGERYVEELARALADRCETRLVSFGPRAIHEVPKQGLERIVLRSWTRNPITPFAPGLRAAVRGFDVVHAFQYYTLPTFLAAFWGRRQGSRVFVTDLGGGGWTPGYQIDQSRWIDGYLPLSEYAARSLPGRPRPHRVIYGGVDLDKFRMRERLEHDGSVVFLGRLLPHKGVHMLIEAMPAELQLHVIGPAADAGYLGDLRVLASGKRVSFCHGLSDADVVRHLQRAMALVHPTPVDDTGSAGAHELLGLAVLEAMACGCPVIGSAVASLVETVTNGVSGVLTQPNDPASIRAAVDSLRLGDEGWKRMALAGRSRVEAHFTWLACAERSLGAYQEAVRWKPPTGGRPQAARPSRRSG